MPFDRIWNDPPRPGEDWSRETSRFATLARRVWDPLLAVEEVGRL
ncbi:hypothetical protein ACFS2C_10530 [Prauserella oleivorans]|uniref:SAM-dependent methyltransferase n=1 Tax=Prauserella oleivorans TaxID=1478153 RepID=A0ABW5W779_9PSEU